MKSLMTRTRLFVAAVCLTIAHPGLAATAVSSSPINATVSTTCTPSSTGMDFGEVGIAGSATAPTHTNDALAVTCATGGAYDNSGAVCRLSGRRLLQNAAYDNSMQILVRGYAGQTPEWPLPVQRHGRVGTARPCASGA